jgi:hypothetical protein
MKMRCKQVRDKESETKQDRRAGTYGIPDTSRTNGVHKGKRSRPARHGDACVGPDFCPCRCAIRNPHCLFRYCSSSASITNCAITANTTGAAGSGASPGRRGIGGGIYGSPNVANGILWNDDSNEIAGGVPAIRYSDIEGGWAGSGNINAEPLFVDPASGDYHLSAGPPVIDAGNNTAVPAGTVTDLDGNPRFVDDPSTPDCQWAPGTCGNPPIADIGAYEFQVVGCIGDLDGDGDTDLADLGILLANFDTPCP